MFETHGQQTVLGRFVNRQTAENLLRCRCGGSHRLDVFAGCMDPDGGQDGKLNCRHDLMAHALARHSPVPAESFPQQGPCPIETSGSLFFSTFTLPPSVTDSWDANQIAGSLASEHSKPIESKGAPRPPLRRVSITELQCAAIAGTRTASALKNQRHCCGSDALAA